MTKNLAFAAHLDWYTVVPEVGCAPTENAPEEAMERYNRNHVKRNTQMESVTSEKLLERKYTI